MPERLLQRYSLFFNGYELLIYCTRLSPLCDMYGNFHVIMHWLSASGQTHGRDSPSHPSRSIDDKPELIAMA